MHSLEDAIDLIATHLPNPGEEHVFVSHACGRILREEQAVGVATAENPEIPVIAAGTRLSAAHLAALELRQFNTVPTARPFSWTVAQNGQDLVKQHQVCRILEGSGLASVRSIRFLPTMDSLPDFLAEFLTDHPNLILAGVDLSWRDTVMIPLLKTLGFGPVCQEVSMLPGGKLWFGQARTEQSILMMSGDTYAHMMVAHRLLLPALGRLCGEAERKAENVVLNKDVRFTHDFTLLVPARLKFDYHGQCSADPLPLRPDQEAATLADSHGYLEFSRTRDFFQQGELVPFYRW